MQSSQPDDVSVLHQGLIDQLKIRGHISSERVEAAFRAIPRHLFLPEVALEEVYRDQAITTKAIDGQFVSSSSQPTIMAIMLEQLQLEPGQRVLEIGAGTGYNAALMAHIVGESGRVVTIDIDEDIVEGARVHLAHAGYERVQVLCGDGALGYAAGAPYDRVILTVSAGDIMPAWREQLRPGGRLLLPLSLRGPQVSVAFEQQEECLVSISVRACGFVGLRGAFAEQETLVKLHSEPLFLKLGEYRAIDTQAVYQLLLGPSWDIALGVQVPSQMLRFGLGFWLALHEPRFCELLAYGSMVGEGIVPELLRYSGKVVTCSTFGLFGEQSLSVLMHDPVQSLPDDCMFDSVPLNLSIRSFGSDTSLAYQLKKQVMTWDAVGHLDEHCLHIKAYPQGDEYSIARNDIIVSKRWMQFVCYWR